ncbi:UDP-N-acetylmuramoyl-tripeptide--D-alanyl-D-alanine ligase [Aureimonas populi]|uniref:UDP-N-acetylmuramoyl-tripeptide--D-alanyl-D-alanine ligase n=1 Tax=Aureimonas populi TaxID=1701758 RepID=A0ABW5CJ94_9HYPH|nr:UDP-N-acetylmuramoyl-tripeptide--D-alanyl-D-alanine ligase [Aureimonas populi]
MSGALWTGADLVAATGGRPVADVPHKISGISIDSRTVQPGEAFFAIKGDRFDGHDFLTGAVAAGAGLLVVSKQKLPALGKLSAPLLVVDDVLKALERLAAAARKRSQARIVAITGSVGKTTSKEALARALAPSGSVHASAASFNNHWGVPLSLARLPAETHYAVFEIGMNHPGEIRPLVKLVRPHAAIVTLIAPAHLGFFSGLAEIAQAKGEIFEGVEPGGTAIVNADDPYGQALGEMARKAGVSRVLTFGEAAGADFRLGAWREEGEGALLSATIAGHSLEGRIGTRGRHIGQNVLAVLGAASVLGADVDAAAAALAEWRAGKGRGERREIETGEAPILLLDESYNANPTSMRAALAVLGDTPPAGDGRRVALLGDMRELGGHSRKYHVDLAGPIAQAQVDAVFLVGDEIRPLSGALGPAIHCEWHRTVEETQAGLAAYLKPGDVLMAKASNAVGLSKLIERLPILIQRPDAPALDADASGEGQPC